MAESEDLSGASFELAADLPRSVVEEVLAAVIVHFLRLYVPGFPRAALIGRGEDFRPIGMPEFSPERSSALSSGESLRMLFLLCFRLKKAARSPEHLVSIGGAAPAMRLRKP